MRQEDFDEVFPHLLKWTIKNRGYSLKEISNILDISVSTMTRYVRGELRITARDANLIIDTLKIDSDDLFNPPDHVIDFIKADKLSEQKWKKERAKIRAEQRAKERGE